MSMVPKSCKLYCLPENVRELPSLSRRGGGMALNLATCWRIWEGFSWSLHWLIPELEQNSFFNDSATGVLVLVYVPKTADLRAVGLWQATARPVARQESVL